MTYIPEDLKYTSEHEWVRTLSANKVRVGITEHAQKQLGDIVFVEFPAIDGQVVAGEAFGTLESVKAVSEVYMPVTGEVTARNDRLGEDPELINTDPYGDGWLIEVTLSTPSTDGLMTAKEYGAYLTAED
ncbi:glycine cleavage system protein GcvH [Streptomyces sp. NPDC002779]|uniref:glycine cleavage system protein GcvH n=1 Tax=Streptomyces sp. NPDC002779 TaxID=3364664 RepID=UPI00368AE41D